MIRYENVGYDAALIKAWEQLAELADKDKYAVEFLSDVYEISINGRSVYLKARNAPAKDFLSVLLLHYLIGHLKKVFAPSGRWISFKEAEGGEAYYPAFRGSVLDIILKKYGALPEMLLSPSAKLKARKIEGADVAVEIAAFPDVLIRILLWRQDSEFPPEATAVFDSNLTRLYPTEDIVVLMHLLAIRI